jgi:DNA-binding SARP family transcriptional activator/tetratricopeptide (TPR) repeat protein
VDCRILGPLEVEDGSGQLDLGGERQRAVLGWLLLNANQFVSSDRLLDELWGSPAPPGARSSLQSIVSRLRQRLGAGEEPAVRAARIVSRNRAYRIVVGPDELDSLRFERLFDQARAALAEDAPTASSLLREALALWHGDVLDDLRDQPHGEPATARLRHLRRQAVEVKAEADLGAGREADVISEVRAAIADDPYNERLRQHLMVALYRTGRAAEAVDVYFDLAELLDERGMRPSRELHQLHQQIQRQEDTPGQSRQRPASAPPPEAPAGQRMFVGREPELRHLRDALRDARAGQGRLVLLGGEMGIGKSHLARELVREAAPAGVEALWGRVWEEEGAPVYWPWIQITRLLLESRDDDWLRQRLGTDAGVLAQVFPDVAERMPGLPEPPPLQAGQDRFRLFDAFTRFLRRASSDRPLALLLDDLHRADVPSLGLLRFVTRNLGDARLLVVATYRDARADQTDEFVGTLAELSREPVTTRLTLRGFSEPEVASFVEQATGARVPGAYSAKLHDRTGGNPLFLKEVVLPLAEGQDVEAFGRDLDEHVPQGVVEAVQLRLAQMPAPAREVLDKAAVIGQQFTLEVLTELTGSTPDALLDLLDEAIALDYVAPVTGFGRNRFRFAHALIWQALYQRVPSARRGALHQRVGEALETVYASDLELRYIELAHHFLEAAGDAGSPKALAYHQLAGQQALAALAYEDAVRLFELALQQPTERDRRCELLLSLADARMRAGDMQAARATWVQAADSAKALGDRELFARAALGYGGQQSDFGLVNQRLIELLEEALELLDADRPALRARVLARLGEALYWVEAPGAAERRDALSAEAVRLARGSGDQGALAAALHGRWYATWAPDTAEERRTLADELVRVASRAGDRQMALRGRMWSVVSVLELGAIEAAGVEIEEYAAEAQALGQPHHRAWPALWLGAVAILQGRLGAAEELNREALAAGARAPDAALIEDMATLQQWFLDDERGRRDALEGALESFTDRFPGFASWRLPLALRQLAAGDPGTARAELDRFLDAGLDGARRDANWLATMTLLAEISATLGETAAADDLYRLLAPYADRSVVLGFGAACRGSVALQLGQLAALLGRREDAEVHFAAAFEANQRMGARAALAHTRYRRALALLAGNHGTHLERACELLAAAERTARELGMTGLADDAARALDAALSTAG